MYVIAKTHTLSEIKIKHELFRQKSGNNAVNLSRKVLTKHEGIFWPSEKEMTSGEMFDKNSCYVPFYMFNASIALKRSTLVANERHSNIYAEQRKYHENSTFEKDIEYHSAWVVWAVVEGTFFWRTMIAVHRHSQNTRSTQLRRPISLWRREMLAKNATWNFRNCCVTPDDDERSTITLNNFLFCLKEKSDSRGMEP